MVETLSMPNRVEDFVLPSLAGGNLTTIGNERFSDMLAELPANENQELKLLLSSKPIVLQGMLFSMHFAGDDLLKAQISGLGEHDFNQLKNRVEDLMQAIDKSHASREHCFASSWEASGTKTTGGETDFAKRSRSLKLRMFPRSFSNDLARIKEDLVYQRLRNCINIETYSSGRFKQMIYILPYSNAPKMIALIEEANMEIAKINSELIKYVQSSDYAQLLGVLEDYPQAKRDIQGRSWHIPLIRYEVMPLQLDTGAVMEMVSQVDIKDAKIAAEYKHGMDLLQRKLESKSRDMMQKVLGALKKEIDTHVGNIIAKMTTDPKNIKADMDALKAKAASVGLASLVDTVIEPLQIALEDPDKAYKTFNIVTLDGLQDAVDDRMVAVLRNLGPIEVK
jgi:hypothetical protein